MREGKRKRSRGIEKEKERAREWMGERWEKYEE